MTGRGGKRKQGGSADGGPPRIVWESPSGGRIESAGGSRPFLAAAGERDLWVWVAGRTWRLERGQNLGAAGGRAGDVNPGRSAGRGERRPLSAALEAASPTSPIPGSVLKVSVRPGERVEAGALLVTISAMKMEHEIRAETAGTVAAVRVKEGDRVEAGAVVVEIEVESQKSKVERKE